MEDRRRGVVLLLLLLLLALAAIAALCVAVLYAVDLHAKKIDDRED